MKLGPAFWIIALFNLFLLYFAFGKPDFSTRMTGHTGFELLYEGPKARTPEKPVAEMLLFLHADSDCDCLEDWSNWVALHDQLSEKITIRAIFNGLDPESMKSFAEGMNLPFNIYVDVTGKQREKYHAMPRQIVKVVLDLEGHVIYADSYQAHPRDQAYFVDRVHRLIDWLDG